MTTAIDTLQIAKDLQAASFIEAQAEALARLLRERQEANLSQVATKADLAALRGELVQLEQRLTIKPGSMLALAIGLTAALIKLL